MGGLLPKANKAEVAEASAESAKKAKLEKLEKLVKLKKLKKKNTTYFGRIGGRVVYLGRPLQMLDEFVRYAEALLRRSFIDAKPGSPHGGGGGLPTELFRAVPLPLIF